MTLREKIIRGLEKTAKSLRGFFRDAPEALEKKRLQDIFNKSAASPEGEKLVRFIQKKKVKIEFTRATDYAHYRTGCIIKKGRYKTAPGQQTIELNPGKSDAFLSGAILHEARHIQQAFAGSLRPHKLVSPFDLVWFTRITEADASASHVLSAFELKLKGDDSLLEAARKTFLHPLCSAAENHYAEDPSSLEGGRLKRQIFDAWFSRSFKDTYEEITIRTDWPGVNNLLEKFPRHGFRKTPLTLRDIKKIGVSGGEKKNYLTLPGFRPLNDPYYKNDFKDSNLPRLQALNNAWEKSFQTPHRQKRNPAP